jgi:hypothetical protein
VKLLWVGPSNPTKENNCPQLAKWLRVKNSTTLPLTNYTQSPKMKKGSWDPKFGINHPNG